MKAKFLRILRDNAVVLGYIAAAATIELTAVCVTSGKFWIRNPLTFSAILAFCVTLLLLLRSQKTRYRTAFCLLLVQAVLDLVFVVIYDMTGSTFDFSMLKLRNDATAIIESIPINFVFFAVAGGIVSLYVILCRALSRRLPRLPRRLPRAAVAAVLAVTFLLHTGAACLNNRGYDPTNLVAKLYASGEGTYADRGILGNFVNEMYKGAFFDDVPLGDAEELHDFIYASRSDEGKDGFAPSGVSDAFGVAKGYNVVTILGESLEWFGFMHGFPGSDARFAGGFGDVEEQVLREIYPNLYEFYDASAACINHYSYEKTDISENQSILGNYPTDCYINYDYPRNACPYGLPNILRTLEEGEFTANAFHDGEYEFYNRNIHHVSALGFDSYTSSRQMADLDGFDLQPNWHNYDSQMIDACKTMMFPSDKRFYTYITTITTHGQYEEREILAEHYAALWDAGVAQAFAPEQYRDKAEYTFGYLEEADPFIHYAAAVRELDKAIGVMIDYLRRTPDERNGGKLIEHTIISLFGDHNAYYQHLTNDVKGIYLDDLQGRKYTDLYRVPLMIRVGDGAAQDAQGAPLARRIDKFTTTYDLVPTLLDLLGIRFFDNLCFGHTALGDEASVLYSRAYDVFITDEVCFSSVRHPRYRSEKADDAYMDDVIRRATPLLEKMGHINRIYRYDFLSGDKEKEFREKLREINKN